MLFTHILFEIGMTFLANRIQHLGFGEIAKHQVRLATIFAVYGLIASVIYFLAGLGKFELSFAIDTRTAGLIVGFFFLPSLFEELIWRWILITPDVLGSFGHRSIRQIIFSSIMFTIAHPIAALLFVPHAKEVFLQPAFLIIVFLLGLTCGSSYVLTKSIWPAVVIHWLTVLAWKFLLGGLFVMLGR